MSLCVVCGQHPARHPNNEGFRPVMEQTALDANGKPILRPVRDKEGRVVEECVAVPAHLAKPQRFCDDCWASGAALTWRLADDLREAGLPVPPELRT